MAERLFTKKQLIHEIGICMGSLNYDKLMRVVMCMWDIVKIEENYFADDELTYTILSARRNRNTESTYTRWELVKTLKDDLQYLEYGRLMQVAMTMWSITKIEEMEIERGKPLTYAIKFRA